MKKFINKLTSSSKLEIGELKNDTDDYDEQQPDNHIRKAEPLDSGGDHRDGASLEPEDFKFKKSFSLRTLSPLMKPKDSMAMDADDDFNKKKSSSMKIIPSIKLNDKEKLHESDDKTLKKSFSFANVFKTDSPKPELLKSPSALKNSLTSQYEQHYDFGDESDDTSSEDEGAQKVPKKGARRRTKTTNEDFTEPHTPVTKLASSAPVFHAPPSPSLYHQQPYHATPVPTLQPRGTASSPPPIVPVLGNSPSPPRAQHPPESPAMRTQASPPRALYPESPAMRTQASPPRAQDFADFPPMRTQASPPRAQDAAMRAPQSVQEPELDDFDLQFGRMRSDSNVSDDGTLISGNSTGFFSAFSNKSRKLF